MFINSYKKMVDTEYLTYQAINAQNNASNEISRIRGLLDVKDYLIEHGDLTQKNLEKFIDNFDLNIIETINKNESLLYYARENLLLAKEAKHISNINLIGGTLGLGLTFLAFCYVHEKNMDQAEYKKEGIFLKNNFMKHKFPNYNSLECTISD